MSSPKLTVKQLQTLLTRIGSASSGTKDVLQARLTKDVRKSLLPDYYGLYRPARQSIRVLSIDMGIKNLAYCVADVDSISKEHMSANMKIVAWRKLNVMREAGASVVEDGVDGENGLNRGKDDENANENGVENEHEDEEKEDDVDMYSPGKMAETAYQLIIHSLLLHSPKIILIERQRWRSSGGSAIQQWTVRVNTFEGMLWAILNALQGESVRCSPASKLAEREASRYRIFGVDPKRVGNFWVGGEVSGEVSKGGKKQKRTKKGKVEQEEEEVDEAEDDAKKVTTTKKLSRGKAEKKAKIALLRTWLTPTKASTQPSLTKAKDNDPEPPSVPHISFEFSNTAERTRQVLCTPTKASQKKRGTKDPIDGREIRKLDDFTDCFLQAAAWVAWETNRLRLEDEWGRKK